MAEALSLQNQDRRPDRRLRSMLRGVVTYGDGAYSFLCRIRDFTSKGARIELPQGATFPASVFLILVPHRVAHEAAVRWYDNGEVGLKFLRSIPLDESLDDKLGYLKRLWHGSAPRVGGFDN